MLPFLTMKSIPISNVPKLDTIWYSQFQKLGSFHVINFLAGNKKFREKQKKEFLKNPKSIPQLDLPKINIAELKTRREKLISLKEKIIAAEKNPIVIRAYSGKIEEKIKEIELLQAAKAKDFATMNQRQFEVYGRPSREIFFRILNFVHSEILVRAPREKRFKEISHFLRNEIPFSRQGFKQPNKKLFLLAQDDTRKLSRFLTRGIKIENKIYSAREISRMFNLVLAKPIFHGWKSRYYYASTPGINVIQEKKLIDVPYWRKLDANKLKSLIVHEIGTHILRRVNGEQGPLMLLGLGLAGYEKGEEGVTTMREQTIKNNFYYNELFWPYFALGLGLGLDGKKRDFPAVYSIMEKMISLRDHFFGSFVPAQETAWNIGVRLFRGTDCRTPGQCFIKDKVYLEGNLKVWESLAKNPGELERLNLGKYDPANPAHIRILDQLYK